MSSIVDERGFNQAYQLNIAQRARLQRRARAIVSKIRLSAEHGRNLDVHILELAAERASSLSNSRVRPAGRFVFGTNHESATADKFPRSKKNMLSSHPIGCHGSPQANFR